MSSLRKGGQRERELLCGRVRRPRISVRISSLQRFLARTFLLHFALCSYPSVVFCPKDPSYGLPTSPLPGRRCCRLSTGQTGGGEQLLLFVALRAIQLPARLLIPWGHREQNRETFIRIQINAKRGNYFAWKIKEKGKSLGWMDNFVRAELE